MGHRRQAPPQCNIISVNIRISYAHLIRKFIFFDREYNYKKGVEWYKRQFPPHQEKSRLLDATPRYLYIKDVPERISKLNVSSKFIVMIREPLSRSYSAWNMYSQLFKSFGYRGRLKENIKTGHFASTLIDSYQLPDYNILIERELNYIDQTDDDYEPSLIKRGLYKDQILNWLDHYDSSEILFLQMEKMKSDEGLKETLTSVLNFLDISCEEDYFKNLHKSVKHKRAYTAPMDSMINQTNKNRLAEFFKSRNEGLDELIGQEIKWLNNR